MDYKKRMLKGSFRGIGFEIKSHTMSGGRRVAQHEFPHRDNPFSEDLGRKSREFSISAYVVGSDYMSQRDLLVKALQEKGVGKLIHPYLGEMEVRCRNFSISENSSSGRVCEISMSFIEEGKALQVTKITSPKITAKNKVSGFIDKSVQGFSKTFKVKNFPDFVANSAVGDVKNVLQSLESGRGIISSQIEVAEKVFESIQNLKNRALEFASNPKDLGLEISSIITKTGTESSITIDEKIESPVKTPSRNQELENKKSLNQLVQNIVLANKVTSILEGDFETREDAIEKRKEILGSIDKVMETTLDSDLFEAMYDLRNEMAKLLPEGLENVPNLVKIKTTSDLPALLVSHYFLGDASKVDEVISRNKIENACFVPGGIELEVSSE